MKERRIILTAKFISMLFAPFYLPIVGMLVLFTLSYLSLLPPLYKIMLLLQVWLFTIFLPTMLIRVYNRYQNWRPFEIGTRERRMIPYVISILCYLLCSYVMEVMHIPHFMRSIIIAALAIQITCSIINLFWKISTHTAGIGGMAGALMAFAQTFSFNPVWWLCLVIIVAGVLGTSRMILRQHTLHQVVGGFVTGLLCAFLAIMI